MEHTDFDSMSTKELHDRAVHRAVRHVDVGFMWRLVEAVPAAEAAAGDLRAADADVMSMSSLLNDLAHLDDGPLAEALRPLYIGTCATTRSKRPRRAGVG